MNKIRDERGEITVDTNEIQEVTGLYLKTHTHSPNWKSLKVWVKVVRLDAYDLPLLRGDKQCKQTFNQHCGQSSTLQISQLKKSGPDGITGEFCQNV